MHLRSIDEKRFVTSSGKIIERVKSRYHHVGKEHAGGVAVNGRYLKSRGQYVHRLVWEAFNGPIPEGLEVHHIDGNGHNNSLENLRCVTHAENLRGHNKRTKGKTTSKYRGVCFASQSQRWIGQVKKNYKNHRTSNYKSELVAAVMRDCLARDLGFPLDAMNFNGKVG